MRVLAALKFAPAAGLAAVWVAYPGLTPAFKHSILPFVFPDPDAKKAEE